MKKILVLAELIIASLTCYAKKMVIAQEEGYEIEQILERRKSVLGL